MIDYLIDNKMEVDDAMKKLGFCGRWQFSLFSLVLITLKTQAAWHVFSILWIGYKPPHHCQLPADNSSLEQWIPLDASGKLSSCSIFANSSNHTTACAHGWTFDETVSGPTIVKKWNLVCERTYLIQSSQTVLMFGMSMSLVTTKFSDRFGRKWVLIICNILLSLFGILSTLVNSLELFFVTRFFIGFFTGAMIMSKLVYLTESFSLKSRAFYTINSLTYWGLAASILPLIAYLMANWIHLQLFISIYGLVFVPFLIWWLPETVPWLHANDRVEEAEQVLIRLSNYNQVTFPRPIIKPLQVHHQKEKEESLLENNMAEKDILNESLKVNKAVTLKRRFLCKSKGRAVHLSTQYSLLELVRNRYLLRHMILAIIIFIDNIGYYGVSYMSASLSVNRFLSGFLNAFVEVPACILVYFAVKKLGMKKPILINQAIAALSIFVCILSVSFEDSTNNLFYVTLACNVMYKFFVSGAYAVIFIYGTELFPTNLRNQAIGICMLVGRTGAIIATCSSFVIQLYPRALYACFGCLTLLGGLLTMLLPETSNKQLPETLQEIEAWYDKGHQSLSREDEDDECK